MEVEPGLPHRHADARRRLELGLEREQIACERAGITGFVLGGVDPEDWKRQGALARARPGRVFPTYGIHPWRVAGLAREPEPDRALARDLLALETELESPSRVCVAVGETGLDFHSRFDPATHALQEEAFRAQLAIAARAGLPIVLHVVGAHDRALELLREGCRAASRSGWTGIVHSFADEPRVAREYLALGLIPSISASVVTRGKGPAFEKTRQTMITLLATEFVLETDAPDQPPYPRKEGEIELNAPVNLLRVADAVAAIRGETREQVLDTSRDRIRQLFGIGDETQ
jgi:TatD DNase family protein